MKRSIIYVILALVFIVAACDKKEAVKLPGAKPPTSAPRTQPTLVNEIDGRWTLGECNSNGQRPEFRLQGTRLVVYDAQYSELGCSGNRQEENATEYLVGVYKDPADPNGANLIISFPEENVEVKVKKITFNYIVLDNTYDCRLITN